jgi:pSer/pThr/pTyr-binding forkhead associated (FHA) protein
LLDNLCSLQNCIVLSRSKASWDNFDYYGKNDNKTFVVFNFPSNEITLGRSKECSIRLNNFSVSRKHCSITLDKETKKIFLKDNDSKYGTLINNYKYSSDITLNDSNKELTVQKGNKVYQFKYSCN